MANSRPFLDFLREHRGGVTHDELSDALQELVAAVTAEGKGGTLTFKIKVKPAGKSGALEVTDEVKVTAPAQTRSASIFYASPENNLIREDPKQIKLDLRQIPTVPQVGLA
jgi:hypothetical protein